MPTKGNDYLHIGEATLRWLDRAVENHLPQGRIDPTKGSVSTTSLPPEKKKGL